MFTFFGLTVVQFPYLNHEKTYPSQWVNLHLHRILLFSRIVRTQAETSQLWNLEEGGSSIHVPVTHVPCFYNQLASENFPEKLKLGLFRANLTKIAFLSGQQTLHRLRPQQNSFHPRKHHKNQVDCHNFKPLKKVTFKTPRPKKGGTHANPLFF